MKKYSKVFDIVFNILKWVVAVILLFMLALTFIEVIRRYFFHQNWVWSEVLVRYMIVWVTFLGGGAAYREGSLVNFDLITQKLSEKAQAILEIICAIIILVMVLWLTKLGISTFLKPSITNQIITELGISVRWIYMGIPLGFVATFMAALEKLMLSVKKLKQTGVKAREEGEKV